MSNIIELGIWGSVFAVPNVVVDKGLKLASDVQLKVLLYILRNSDTQLTDELVAEKLSIHIDDVRDALDYWSQKGLSFREGRVVPVPESTDILSDQDTDKADSSETSESDSQSSDENVRRKPKPLSRAIKPEPAYVAKRLKADKDLVLLLDEAQRILGKVLSNVDTATLIMLHDTDGLPVEVILMLMEYASGINRANLRFIERTGIEWGEEGIVTVALAEEKLRRYGENSEAFKRVSAVFGLKAGGTPTKKQLEFADTWVNVWGFSDDMLRLAYEMCVDRKGEMKMPYINGILKRFYEKGFKNPTEVSQAESSSDGSKKNKKREDKGVASYDLDQYESKSMFDD